MNPPATLHETLAVVLARTFVDGEVGFTGLLTGAAAAAYGTSIPLAAMELARRTHAPNLTILLAGCYHNPVLDDLERLPDSEHDALLRDLPCEAQMTNYPGPWVLKRGDVRFGFSSAVQVDRVGNINSVCIGDHDKPKVRLVGPILQPEHMTLFGREYVMMPHHDRRNFVENVDYVSGVGYPGGLAGRRELGLMSSGPCMVVTPKCIFDFDRQAGRMKVASIHAGVSEDALRKATGFDLGDLGGVPRTQAPSDEELSILRSQVDPRNILGLRE
ncbi:CoA-transferase [Caballeronia ptereochthonis]|uniref:Acyl CoA-acetate/3-ketoacid CoA transferase beta subunit n=1 Tax=Caballeronia ptereochthonis TaxID=1777144 RepID=A0A157ZTL2_9BURK|nr:CoA-transferase [Caballeronia ptereochthonis]SAK48878.1 Acyl CoA-acetate/3-ketoacid CoA transferase beta subunit [Caballeronia ptereochthonis]